MPKSYYETESLICPQCEEEFRAKVWLIVDATERPDLVEKIRQRTLHEIVCPHCHFEGEIDAPLLLFKPDAARPLMFFPTFEMEEEEAREIFQELLHHLIESYGADWNAAWGGQDIPFLPQELQSVVSSEDPEKALREMLDQNKRNLEHIRHDDPELFLDAAIQSFITFEEADEKRALLEMTPELLTDQAQLIMEEYLEDAIEDGDEELVQEYKQNIALLQLCRTEGIAKAFADFKANSKDSRDKDEL